MKKIILVFIMLCAGVWARAQHTHIVYFDENGNPIEEAGHDHEGHEGHSHDDNDGHDHGEHEDHDHAEFPVETGRLVSHSFTGVAPRFGLAVQKGFFAEVGVSLDLYKLGYTEGSEYLSFGYSNIRPYVSGEILAGRKLLGGGKAGAEYIMSTPILGMAVGGDVSYYSDGLRDAVTLTPRLMLSFVYVEVYYGYNFFLHNELTRWIGHHRFGVSMTLNRGFWRRKKEVYQDYYDSYSE